MSDVTPFDIPTKHPSNNLQMAITNFNYEGL